MGKGNINIPAQGELKRSLAVIVHCIWAAVILLVHGAFETIASGMVFAVLIFYALTTIALFKLRREQQKATEIFKVPFYLLLPVIYLIGVLSLLGLRAWYEWQATLIDLLFIISGLLFALYFTKRKRAAWFKMKMLY